MKVSLVGVAFRSAATAGGGGCVAGVVWRLSAGHAAAQERETQDEAQPQPRGAAIPGSRAVRHAADLTRQ